MAWAHTARRLCHDPDVHHKETATARWIKFYFSSLDSRHSWLDFHPGVTRAPEQRGARLGPQVLMSGEKRGDQSAPAFAATAGLAPLARGMLSADAPAVLGARARDGHVRGRIPTSPCRWRTTPRTPRPSAVQRVREVAAARRARLGSPDRPDRHRSGGLAAPTGRSLAADPTGAAVLPSPREQAIAKQSTGHLSAARAFLTNAFAQHGPTGSREPDRRSRPHAAASPFDHSAARNSRHEILTVKRKALA